MQPDHVSTYRVTAPAKTHLRPATCKEVDCANWQNGFRSVVDVSTDLGQRQAAYIETLSARRFIRSQAGSIVTYDFHPGQQCFQAHTVPLERPALYVIRDGKARPRTVSADEWVDRFADHTEKIKKEIG